MDWVNEDQLHMDGEAMLQFIQNHQECPLEERVN